MRRRFAIRECARLWREEQSLAIDKGDVARAAHAEKCARRFDECLTEEQPQKKTARSCWVGFWFETLP
jgi:hypothetical protein